MVIYKGPPNLGAFLFVINGLLKQFAVFFCLFGALACQSSSNSDSSDAQGSQVDLTGAIATQFGGQKDMEGWIVVLLEKETSTARVAEVDAAGIYTLTQVQTDKAYTLVLLAPDFIVSGVLSAPGSEENKQYFKFNRTQLPRAIYKGDTVVFSSSDGITYLDATADVVDDADIDGDGTPNVFDLDDDDDDTADIFDDDANGNDVLDADESIGDLYFSSGMKFISVQYELSEQDASTSIQSLVFTAMLRSDVTPLEVRARGAAGMFNEAVTESGGAWDETLLDDGDSEDGAAEDGLYGRRVTLASATVPRANQVVFLQLAFGTAESPWFQEFPFTFGDLTPETITATYDTSTRTMTLGGTPFGESEDYVWSVQVYNDDDKTVYTSESVDSSESELVLPSSILEANKSYTASLVARTVDRIAGYSSYVVRSAKIDLQ